MMVKYVKAPNKYNEGRKNSKVRESGTRRLGIPYTGSSINMKMSLRIAYVAMSRPRYMLCMAIQKENYKLLDSVRLSNLWEIIEI